MDIVKFHIAGVNFGSEQMVFVINLLLVECYSMQCAVCSVQCAVYSLKYEM